MRMGMIIGGELVALLLVRWSWRQRLSAGDDSGRE
jgi:hypothetical protein